LALLRVVLLLFDELLNSAFNRNLKLIAVEDVKGSDFRHELTYILRLGAEQGLKLVLYLPRKLLV